MMTTDFRDTLDMVAVKDVVDLPHLEWAKGQSFSLPVQWLKERGGIREHDSENGVVIGPPREPFAERDIETLRLMAAFTEEKPTSSRLPISYQRVPPRIRDVVARIAGRRQRRKLAERSTFPGWPLDLSADCLADIGGVHSPYAFSASPVLLTHDLDSPAGLRNLVKHFLPLEEGVGATSVNYVVPCAWPIDRACLADVQERGHEIGTHGYDHSNTTAFCATAKRGERIAAGLEALSAFDIRGYRAPSLLRTRELLRDLRGSYAYDASIPTSGGAFPVPDTGCASARPFLVDGLSEIPLSMPRDGSLRFLGYAPEDILKLWIQCAEQIAASGGVVVVLTHCEERFSGNGPMLRAYEALLDFLAEDERFRWATSADILASAFNTATETLQRNRR